MIRRIHIFIAHPSLIIRSGVQIVLSRIAGLDIDIAGSCDLGTLPSQIKRLSPNILIVDPAHLGAISPQQIKEEYHIKNLKVVALQTTHLPPDVLQQYDDVFSIFQNPNEIKQKIIQLTQQETESSTQQELSAREQEIIICIVKGMSNKQIAEALCLSPHTITTHRRNITNKLQIHSPAGLTIYAIVNGLVSIDEVKTTITS